MVEAGQPDQDGELQSIGVVVGLGSIIHVLCSLLLRVLCEAGQNLEAVRPVQNQHTVLHSKHQIPVSVEGYKAGGIGIALTFDPE